MSNLKRVEKPQPLANLKQLVDVNLSESIQATNYKKIDIPIAGDLRPDESERTPSYNHSPSTVKP